MDNLKVLVDLLPRSLHNIICEYVDFKLVLLQLIVDLLPKDLHNIICEYVDLNSILLYNFIKSTKNITGYNQTYFDIPYLQMRYNIYDKTIRK